MKEVNNRSITHVIKFAFYYKQSSLVTISPEQSSCANVEHGVIRSSNLLISQEFLNYNS